MAAAYKGLARRGKARSQLLAMFMMALLCGVAMNHRFLAAALLAPLSPLPPSPRPPRRQRQPRAEGRPGPGRDRHQPRPDRRRARPGRAPVTTANFLHYVDTHRFDGENFYRAMHSGRRAT